MHSLGVLELLDELGITDEDIFINEEGATLEHNNIPAGFTQSNRNWKGKPIWYKTSTYPDK